jgi:sulfur carrier protein
VTVVVNGEPRELGKTTVAELVRELTDEERGVAVAVDGEVVPHAAWASTHVHDGQHVEVLRAVQGG